MSPVARDEILRREGIGIHPAATLFPQMSDVELDELATDIEANGLTSPLCLWRANESAPWQLIDGRNRVAALARLLDGEARISGALTLAAFYEARTDPWAFVVSANIRRRQLSAEQKRDLIAKLLKANPEKSDRSIANLAHADKNTVRDVRAGEERRGEIHHVEKRTDTRGRRQPAAKPTTPRSAASTSSPTTPTASKPPSTPPALSRDQVIVAFTQLLHRKPIDTIEDFARIVGDDRGVRELAPAKRLHLAVIIVRALRMDGKAVADALGVDERTTEREPSVGSANALLMVEPELVTEAPIATEPEPPATSLACARPKGFDAEDRSLAAEPNSQRGAPAPILRVARVIYKDCHAPQGRIVRPIYKKEPSWAPTLAEKPILHSTLPVCIVDVVKFLQSEGDVITGVTDDSALLNGERVSVRALFERANRIRARKKLEPFQLSATVALS